MPGRKSVLFVFTSASRVLNGDPTGWYLPEAAHPYYEVEPHHDIDFAATKGPNPPIDGNSVVQLHYDEYQLRFLEDPVVQKKLRECKYLKDCKASDYDAIFYVGGRGPAIDLATDLDNIKLCNEVRSFSLLAPSHRFADKIRAMVAQFWQSGKIVSAVCHGPCALVNVQNADGTSIYKGKKYTGFSNVEEELIGGVTGLPFLLETKFQMAGGIYVKAEKPWLSNVVRDGKLITGQNPASAQAIGKALAAALAE
ncbi:ThiJ PfpI domain-containing protein [Coniophora puteana RWD-64-598 SS2]|uniref:D-lactate dehydratase n=1 Tax=Coniophora puteana (strain RWD-64-598) TaxID=741705 RepID=A0A5M3MMJ1_CONPW|nr:ThiJ PfpI domain-containing protein [Coniophora puteana RWD-64-598 SS2]EIW79915.1 ThiJ PfpI domain-containing protein [Coniophora puteana RWD-64-598 SS2]